MFFCNEPIFKHIKSELFPVVTAIVLHLLSLMALLGLKGCLDLFFHAKEHLSSQNYSFLDFIKRQKGYTYSSYGPFLYLFVLSLVVVFFKFKEFRKKLILLGLPGVLHLFIWHKHAFHHNFDLMRLDYIFLVSFWIFLVTSISENVKWKTYFIVLVLLLMGFVWNKNYLNNYIVNQQHTDNEIKLYNFLKEVKETFSFNDILTTDIPEWWSSGRFTQIAVSSKQIYGLEYQTKVDGKFWILSKKEQPFKKNCILILNKENFNACLVR